MPSYLHPGVYVEEIPSGSKPIEGVGTSTAAFIGYTTKGPIGEPKLISKWDDYAGTYGGILNLKKSLTGDPMGLSVSAFFQNGGSKAYIVRITEDIDNKDPGARHAVKAVGYVDHPAEVGKKALKFTAANEGAWANEVVVKLERSKVDNDFFDVFIGKESRDQSGNVTFTADETFTMVSLDENNDIFIKKVIDDRSEIVTVDLISDITTLNVESDQFLGTSVSGYLAGVSIDFSGLGVNSRKMKITVDQEAQKTITLDQKDFATLDALADNLQEKVSELDATKECYSRFSCVARDNKLTLTSGSRKSISAVQVDSTYGIAVTLKLGVPSGSYVGTSTSGDLSGFAGLDLTAVPNAANRSLMVSIDGAAPILFDLGVSNYTDLASLANSIDNISGLSCAKEGNALMLTSDSHKSTSSVVVTSDLGVAPVLKLGVAPDDHGGAELSGQQNHEMNLTLGSSTSGDLGSLSLPLALSDNTLYPTPASRSISGKIDGVDFGPYDLGNANLNSLAEIATKIDGINGLSCLESGNRLVLISDTRLSTSSVVITSNAGIAPKLKLGMDNGGNEIAGGSNRDQNYRIQLMGQEHADVSLPKDKLDDGVDGGWPNLSDYKKIFTKFAKYRDINIICLPGKNWPKDKNVDPEGQPVIDLAIAHAEKMKSRMVIVDPPPSHELTDARKIKDMGLPSQTYCVTYYPWVEAANPFYNAERNPGVPKKVLVPPSGYAAGMWAKIDGKRGVWKAAAGMETGLLGISGVQYLVEDDEQDSLNPWGVNCLRKMPGAGPVIWGARTLATKADPEWRYVPVRRTAIMIEQSIYEGIQWAVFEPNNHRLWSALRANIGNFMNGLFRAEAFQGEKASDAYFVRCNLGDTMTQGEIDAGQVIVIVGFAPLKPAEFVIVRIQQKVNQQ